MNAWGCVLAVCTNSATVGGQGEVNSSSINYGWVAVALPEQMKQMTVDFGSSRVS